MALEHVWNYNLSKQVTRPYHLRISHITPDGVNECLTNTDCLKDSYSVVKIVSVVTNIRPNPSHITPDGANVRKTMDQGRKNKWIRSSSFMCVYCRFRVRQCSLSAFLVSSCPFFPVVGFGHTQNLERTLQDKLFRYLYVLLCAGHTFCSELVRFSYCNCQLPLPSSFNDHTTKNDFAKEN